MICIDRFRPRPASNLSPCPELPFAATADHATSAAWTRWARTHAPSLRLCFYMTEMASHSFKKKKKKKNRWPIIPGPWALACYWMMIWAAAHSKGGRLATFHLDPIEQNFFLKKKPKSTRALWPLVQDARFIERLANMQSF